MTHMTHDERRDELLKRSEAVRIKLNAAYNNTMQAQRDYVIALNTCNLETEIIEAELRTLRVGSHAQ